MVYNQEIEIDKNIKKKKKKKKNNKILSVRSSSLLIPSIHMQSIPI